MSQNNIAGLPELTSSTVASGDYVEIVDVSDGNKRKKIQRSALAPSADADLTALAALSGTGIVVHTDVATYTEREIEGTVDEIDVANGGGEAGNPAMSLAAAAKSSLALADSAAQPGDVVATTIASPGLVRSATLSGGAVLADYLLTATTDGAAATVTLDHAVADDTGYNLSGKILGVVTAITGTPPGASVVGDVYCYDFELGARAASSVATLVGESVTATAEDNDITDPGLSASTSNLRFTFTSDRTDVDNFAQIEWSVELHSIARAAA